MILDLSEYYHDIQSEFGEDGILYCLFRLLGHHKIPTYLNVSRHFTRKNGIMNLVRTFGFRNVTHTRVESTLESMKETAFRYPYLDLLRVTRCDGVEYWLVKAILERVRPIVICCDVNLYEKPVSVPYVPLHKRDDLLGDPNYRGVSLSALCAYLSKQKYTFAGVSKHAVRAFFVRNDLVPRGITFSTCSNLSDLPSVKYARTVRWNLVSKKLWITIV